MLIGAQPRVLDRGDPWTIMASDRASQAGWPVEIRPCRRWVCTHGPLSNHILLGSLQHPTDNPCQQYSLVFPLAKGKLSQSNSVKLFAGHSAFFTLCFTQGTGLILWYNINQWSYFVCGHFIAECQSVWCWTRNGDTHFPSQPWRLLDDQGQSFSHCLSYLTGL